MLLLDDDDELPELPDELGWISPNGWGQGWAGYDRCDLARVHGQGPTQGCAHYRAGIGCGRLSASRRLHCRHARRLIGLANTGAVVIFGNPRNRVGARPDGPMTASPRLVRDGSCPILQAQYAADYAAAFTAVLNSSTRARPTYDVGKNFSFGGFGRSRA